MCQALAALVEVKALAARKERETSIMPLCGTLNRRRQQIVQELEDGGSLKLKYRQLRGQLEQVQHNIRVVEAERDALAATYETCHLVKLVSGVCES